MHSTLLTLPLLLASSLVSAHGGVIGYTIGGKRYTTGHVGSGNDRLKFSPANSLQRAWTGLGPVRSSSSPNIACNTPGTPAHTTIEAAAGAPLTAHWNPWPHDGGPLSVWMVECPGDCATFTSPHTASWFKIHDDGLAGTQKLIKAANSLTVTIPASLKSGNYLIRHEVINLARPPAEFYPECAQIKVTGSGTKSPGPESRSTFANAYKMNLPQFTGSYNDWRAKGGYKLPGPAPWKG
ncbi:family 61 putative glycoside hydrolase [Microthyrium microscopicum]|uniref:lytic cellulose monooxygenase (C4-dehydrogenating) n=1 Tax=Microthyrium microscopicum TaxID=703497 RepID=A0A6A6U4P8_9PEZI|nr:family 61 putative glycoside hydrolase [Microthyrium microscopicum]